MPSFAHETVGRRLLRFIKEKLHHFVGVSGERIKMRTRISLALCAALLLLSLLPGAALAQSTAGCARNVTVVAGDTLTGLANTYLDDPLAYNRIIAATNAAAAVDDTFATIDDEGRIVIGWKLCIPGAAAAPRVSAAEGGGPTSTSGGRRNPECCRHGGA